ncbi:MAG: TolC family protein [Pseudomonas sp.]|jgi:outer membrane protein TolC|nr:TolC family protein [Pseudomonas sp.]
MATLQNFQFKLKRLATLIGAITLFAGCAVVPEQLTDSEVRNRVNSDQALLYVEQEQVFKPISFEEAVARALKYNLDYRLKLMESALASGLANLSRYDMLPNLLANAGYASRNNDSGGNSVDIDTGQRTLTNSTSQERNRQLASAEFSWNMLDFGVSYFRAKQQADQYLIAEERRRRVIQNILQDTRASYWRAVGAQRLARDAEVLGERAKSALERSREAEAQGLLPPRDALNYQRMLLDAVALLASRRQELEFAKRELAALMNVTPGTDFTVVEGVEPALMPVPFNIAELEEVALSNRPELREEDFRMRITADEARRQLVTLLPGISFTAGAQYDSNKYLYNNNWIESGVRVSFNLMKALSYPAMKDVQEAQKRNDQARRLALSMAILTQVRVSVERYRLALHDLDIARDSNKVDQRLASYARAAESTRADTELELIRAETRSLNSQYQRYSAYAAAQTAFGRIYNSIGLEVLPVNMETASVAELASVVADNLKNLEAEAFPRMDAYNTAIPPTRLKIELPTNLSGVESNTIRQSVEKMLLRNNIVVLGSLESTAPQLLMKLVQAPSRDGVRRVKWEISVNKGDGKQMGAVNYASTLIGGDSTKVVTAFAEAATIANIKKIDQWLRASEGR